MPELKQALTYEQQVTRLTEHNLKISSRESAIAILKKVNYYRLSAYGIGLAKPDDKEQYIDGITLESLYRLYLFDSLLRNQLVHVIEQRFTNQQHRLDDCGNQRRQRFPDPRDQRSYHEDRCFDQRGQVIDDPLCERGD